MLTCDPDVGADCSDLFNFLTGYSAKSKYRKLLVAPVSLRDRFEELLQREIDHKKAGRPAHLILKMNALVDREMIQLLYQASQAGVKVDLLVRGICCLRPHVPGVSDNIQVTSIVGRFLEHSRIYYFRNAGDEEIYWAAPTCASQPQSPSRNAVSVQDKGLSACSKTTSSAPTRRPGQGQAHASRRAMCAMPAGRKDAFNSQAPFSPGQQALGKVTSGDSRRVRRVGSRVRPSKQLILLFVSIV